MQQKESSIAPVAFLRVLLFAVRCPAARTRPQVRSKKAEEQLAPLRARLEEKRKALAEAEERATAARREKKDRQEQAKTAARFGPGAYTQRNTCKRP